MSLVRGGEYEIVNMQVGATALGDGTAATPFSVTRGSYNLLTAQVTGISGDTITWEGTIDETNWAAIPAYRLSNQSISTTATANGIYRLAVTGLRGVRARVSAWVAGTIYIKGILSAVGELGATGGGSGVSDHSLLSNLSYASSGHTGFEAEGAAAAAIAAHVGLSDPHTQYALESSLGSAALLNVGTSANNVVQLDGTGKLPAVDGSQLTNLPSGGSPGGSTTQVQYNSAGAFAGDAGLTYDASTDRLTIVGGIVAPSMRPASNSTTALQLQNAAGTAVVTVDTTNSRVRIDRIIAPVSNGLSGMIASDGTNDYGITQGWNGFGNSYWFFGVSRYWDGANWQATTGNLARRGAIFDVNSGATCFRWQVAPPSTANATAVANMNATGMLRLGDATEATALIDLAASTTTRSSLRIRSGTAPTTPNAGDVWDDGSLVAYNIDATTNAVVNSLKLRRGSSGTPAAGFGLGIAARLESSTTEDQDAGRLTYEWITATHASRASRGKLSAYSVTTEQTAMTWDGDAGGLKLGFYGVTPVARQVLATGAGATVDDVITALQALGLVKQS